MENNYGNYVIQKALKLSNKLDKITLIQNIYRNINKIKDKKLIEKWKSIIEANLDATIDYVEDSIIHCERKPKTQKIHSNYLLQTSPDHSPNIKGCLPKQNPNRKKDVELIDQKIQQKLLINQKILDEQYNYNVNPHIESQFEGKNYQSNEFQQLEDNNEYVDYIDYNNLNSKDYVHCYKNNYKPRNNNKYYSGKINRSKNNNFKNAFYK